MPLPFVIDLKFAAIAGSAFSTFNFLQKKLKSMRPSVWLSSEYNRGATLRQAGAVTA
jgi:hypothetical protein